MDNTELANLQRQRVLKGGNANNLPTPGYGFYSGLAALVGVVGLISAIGAMPSRPVEFNYNSACRDAVKATLRDPDSFQEIRFAELADGKAEMFFRARNGFGGYNTGLAECTRSGDAVTAALLAG